jgi:hypothetical protein
MTSPPLSPTSPPLSPRAHHFASIHSAGISSTFSPAFLQHGAHGNNNTIYEHSYNNNNLIKNQKNHDDEGEGCDDADAQDYDGENNSSSNYPFRYLPPEARIHYFQHLSIFQKSYDIQKQLQSQQEPAMQVTNDDNDNDNETHASTSENMSTIPAAIVSDTKPAVTDKSKLSVTGPHTISHDQQQKLPHPAQQLHHQPHKLNQPPFPHHFKHQQALDFPQVQHVHQPNPEPQAQNPKALFSRSTLRHLENQHLVVPAPPSATSHSSSPHVASSAHQVGHFPVVPVVPGVPGVPMPRQMLPQLRHHQHHHAPSHSRYLPPHQQQQQHQQPKQQQHPQTYPPQQQSPTATTTHRRPSLSNNSTQPQSQGQKRPTGSKLEPQDRSLPFKPFRQEELEAVARNLEAQKLQKPTVVIPHPKQQQQQPRNFLTFGDIIQHPLPSAPPLASSGSVADTDSESEGDEDNNEDSHSETLSNAGSATSSASSSSCTVSTWSTSASGTQQSHHQQEQERQQGKMLSERDMLLLSPRTKAERDLVCGLLRMVDV